MGARASASVSCSVSSDGISFSLLLSLFSNFVCLSEEKFKSDICIARRRFSRTAGEQNSENHVKPRTQVCSLSVKIIKASTAFLAFLIPPTSN